MKIFVAWALCAMFLFCASEEVRGQGVAEGGGGSATGTKAKCFVRTSALSAGEIALAGDHYAEAAKLFAAQAEAGGPDASRVRDLEIRALLKANDIAGSKAKADAWASADPKSAWSRLARAQVDLRMGNMDDALDGFDAAIAADKCNALARLEMARAFALSGVYASAKRQIEVAHKLDPLDDDIEFFWLATQPRAVKNTEVEKYLQRSVFLSADERKHLEEWKKELETVPSRCHLVNPVAETTIPLEWLHRNGPLVNWGLVVGIEGKNRRLEVDTGASGITLTHAAAASLHLTPQRRTMTTGIGNHGDNEGYVAKVKSIRIGSLEFQDCDVQVFAKDPFNTSDGLIGADVFADFLVTLDFPGQKIKLGQLPQLPGAGVGAEKTLSTGASDDEWPGQDRYVAPEMQDWTRVFRRGHNLLIDTQLNDGPVRLFIIDTGSDLNLVSKDVARSVTKLKGQSDIGLKGLSGFVNDVQDTGPIDLGFAGKRQKTLGMTAIDTSGVSRNLGIEVAGFLGAPTLHQSLLQIDYRDNLVRFVIDRARLHSCVSPGLGECF